MNSMKLISNTVCCLLSEYLCGNFILSEAVNHVSLYILFHLCNLAYMFDYFATVKTVHE